MNDHLHNMGVVDLKHGRQRAQISNEPVVLSSGTRRYPAGVATRKFVTLKKATHGGVRVALLTPLQMFFTRMVSALLIPLMFIAPVARVYADEVVATETTEAPLAPEVSSEPEAPVSEITPLPENTSTEVPPTEDASVVAGDVTVSDNTQTPDLEIQTGQEPETTDAEVQTAQEPETTEQPKEEDVLENTEVGPPEEVPAETTDEIPEGEVAESTEVGPPEELPTEDATLPEVPTGGGGSGGTDTDVPPPEGDTSGGGGATESDTTTPPDDVLSPATSTEEIIVDDGVEGNEVVQEDATTTEEEVVEEDLSPEEISEEGTPVDDSAQIEANRIYQEERLRAELRKEVEQEFLRGCISFEQSGYYCLKNGVASGGDAGARKKTVSVISEQGEGGDKEIFVMRDSLRTVLTSNDWDDTFPTQDVTGEHFVWQGMKNGRWQIFTGTFTASGSPVVTQVTDSRESNFNPKIDGEHLVWQGWADDNWEIFFATKRDAKSPFAGEHLPEGNALLGVGPEWAVERLTKNSEQDMFPSLHGDLITWQAREGNDWVVYAYSIGARKQTKLSSDGVKSENPRFSITWEERDGEGNARLVGYDLSTGEKTDLTREAMKLPRSSFPEPVQTPIAQSDPATLPAPTNSGSSTPVRGDDEGGAGDDLLTP